MSDYVSELMARVKAKNPAEPEFHQAVQEVVESLAVVLEQHPEYRHEKILERIIEPERVIMLTTDAPENPYSALKLVCCTLNSSIASGDGR